ncbi:MAG: hypothetical protein ACD_25C00025G0002 [uncultured bacterium]|uniref:Uncharacterized protein n=1 Tax=candidate division WWE3 bacterium TaxID=2053526 RepID=A0A656PL72_UNCKA|nr:hypothetical protein P147_WWE3C00001G0152 [candidate division WWE3 bacterium RAAC2_WWE3_1]EKD95206.1 MAG: hypothetical protein ACD_25C00025G0002 [uncultured bacterium]KKS30209.1 MAG: hypothetical protein UU91_C0001G0099 [candidate division WWE3 bacterium GW2011_GWB1_42_117]KKS55257.1 MAG: hypothetical protein UV21_C0002G0131 [candidate division WWE3 bacterium GW2011_GWD2_42_34]KKT05809.1 MAG: hypothetical protein UV83_C0001G0127 [candidate division WWE3 bacterium GW2011_GWE2_43_18]KKT07301.
MSANPFINDAESGGRKFEFSEQTNELIESLTKIKDSAEALNIADKRYHGHVLDALRDVVGVDREAEGTYRTFEKIHENAGVLKSGVTRELDKMPAVTGNILNVDELQIRKILGDITDENSQERFAELKNIQDQIALYYHGFMKDRYENLNSRNRIRDRIEEAVYETPSLKNRALEEERASNIRDERVSVVVRKYSSRLGAFVEIVKELNSKAKVFEVENLERVEQSFKDFNRVVVSVKNNLESEKKA